MKIENTIAIITGGAQGLGQGFAEGLVKNGAKVVIADVKGNAGARTANQLNDKYGTGRCTFVKCDVTKQEDLKNLFNKTREQYGNIDIVVNNAGIDNEENRELLLQINLIAVVECSYLALDYMRKDKGGRGGLIVNISSVAGIWEVPYVPVYAAAKHGIVGLTRALGARQEDVVEQGVRVSCLCPSLVRTAMGEAMLKSDNQVAIKMLEHSTILEVHSVVDAFMKIVDNDSLHGAVVMITPSSGVKVLFPDKLKGAKL